MLLVHQAVHNDLNGHAEAPDVHSAEAPQDPFSADRDLQATRPPPRSESLPVSSGTSKASATASEAPSSSLQSPSAQPVASAPSSLGPPSLDNATLSPRAGKRSARESRLNFPDEIRQVIANIPDSQSEASALAPSQGSVLPNVAAVSPMNFDGTFAQHMSPPAQLARGEHDYTRTPTQSNITGFVAPTQSRVAPEPYTDTDDDLSADGHSSTVYSPAESSSRQGIPTIIRNAPSMTSMNTFANPTAIQTVIRSTPQQDDTASFDSSPVAASPTTSTMSTPPPYLHPTHHIQPSVVQPHKMVRSDSQQTTTTMSPPRLTTFDLGTAAITVPVSHIRPNDRGKEVLSFVIEIALDPMSERDGWKIEKLYSDVLALDVKVRQALGRNALKKIAPLPDAKLFKDNAPAKVDQRKVRRIGRYDVGRS